MKFFVCIFFSITVNLNYSQGNLLKEILANSRKETGYSKKELEIKSINYNKLALKTVKEDVLKAKEYSLLSLNIAYQANSDSLLLKSSVTTSALYNMLGLKDSSLFFSKVGLYYSNKLLDNKNSAVLGTLIANSYVGLGIYDSADNYFNKTEKLYGILNDSVLDPTYFFFKINKASLFKELTLYDLMLKELFDAKKKADSIADTNFLAQILGGIAIGYKNNNDIKQAIKYDKQALKYLRKGEIDEAVINTNLGNSFSLLGNVDSAVFYYNIAEQIYLQANSGDLLLQKLALIKADMFLINNIEEPAKEILLNINETTLTVTQKTKFYILKNKISKNPTEKLHFAKKAVEYAILNDNIIDQKDSYYLLYIEQKKLKDNVNALNSFENYNRLKDSIFNKEKSIAIQKVVVQKVIDDKNSEIALNDIKFEKDKAIKDRVILIILTILFFVLLVLTSVYFLYRSQKQKNIIIKKDKELLKNENKEIKNELINVSLESERSSNFLNETRAQLKDIKLSKDKDAKINALFAIISQFVLGESEKKEYQEKVQEVQEDFFEKISEKVKLTKTEKKLAALLKLDLSTKDIAPILKVSENTIEIYRSRLRKKLEIEKEISLFDYFNSL